MVAGGAAVPAAGHVYDLIRKSPVRKRVVEKENGNVDEAFNSAAKVIEAEYEWPYQSHAGMGPGLRDRGDQGRQGHLLHRQPEVALRPAGRRREIGMPLEKVHVIWKTGPGSYGRNDADDCAMDAAVLAKAVGEPVRLQYMRDQGTGWDPKGPASIHVRAALDAAGDSAYKFASKAFSRVDVDTNGSKPWNARRAARGMPLHRATASACRRNPMRSPTSAAWETIAPLLDRASPLRTSHLRDPVGPQIHFASESFIDEVAAALKVDPVEFRLRHVKDARDIALIKAAAEKSGWQPRPRRGARPAARERPRHRLFAAQRHARSGSRRGRRRPLHRQIRARKFTVAHDCGQIINPDALTQCIEGNIIQGMSRTLWEEVKFDRKTVTSVDWMTYPILDIAGRQKIEWCCSTIRRSLVGRRRAVDPAGRGRDRQRDLRRHRRAHPPRAVLARPRQAGIS